MRKTNLINILSNFTPNEMKEMGDFLTSPYFNKNKKVIELFSLLKDLYPDFNTPKSDKEIVYKKLYPGKEYNDGIMRLMIHSLNILCEDFISISKFQRSFYLKDRFLLEYYVLDKKAPKLFERKYNSIKEKNSKIEIKDADFYLNEYEVEILAGKYKFLIDDNILNVTDLPKHEYFRKTEYLKNNFFITILNQYRYLLNAQSLYNVNYEDDFREVVLEYLNKHPDYMKIPILKLHYLELCLLLKDDEKYYNELKKHLIDNFYSFSWLERFSTICILENFCLAMIYREKEQYYEEKHSLHKFILERKLFSKVEGGKMTDTDFQNIAGMGMNLGKIEWAEDFINEYKEYLDEKDKSNVLNLCYARLNLHKKNFDKALSYINEIKEIDNVNYKISKKCITLEIFYEQNLIVEAFGYIDNFKHFISNDRLITDTEKERILKFIKFVNLLLKIKSKNDVSELYILKKEIENTENVYKKKWFFEKIAELKAG